MSTSFPFYPQQIEVESGLLGGLFILPPESFLILGLRLRDQVRRTSHLARLSPLLGSKPTWSPRRFSFHIYLLSAASVARTPGENGAESARSLRFTRAVERHAAFDSIGIFLDEAVFGTLSSSTPFASVALTFPASTAAGKSITRRIWSEQRSL